MLPCPGEALRAIPKRFSCPVCYRVVLRMRAGEFPKLLQTSQNTRTKAENSRTSCNDWILPHRFSDTPQAPLPPFSFQFIPHHFPPSSRSPAPQGRKIRNLSIITCWVSATIKTPLRNPWGRPLTCGSLGLCLGAFRWANGIARP